MIEVNLLKLLHATSQSSGAAPQFARNIESLISQATAIDKSSEKQSLPLSDQDKIIVKDILKRFGITVTDDDLTYDELKAWNELPADYRKRVDPNRIDLDRLGSVAVDPKDNKIRAYIFRNLLEQRSKDYSVDVKIYARFVAIQEAGAKALLAKAKITTARAELVTELMSGRVDPQLAFMTVLPYITAAGSGQNYPDYILLVGSAAHALLEVMTNYQIGETEEERLKLVISTLFEQVELADKNGIKDQRVITENFVSKLAEKAKIKVSTTKLFDAFARAYVEALDEKAYP
jgi:hypothetical protein